MFIGLFLHLFSVTSTVAKNLVSFQTKFMPIFEMVIEELIHLLFVLCVYLLIMGMKE